jgi:hypothetical protein
MDDEASPVVVAAVGSSGADWFPAGVKGRSNDCLVDPTTLDYKSSDITLLDVTLHTHNYRNLFVHGIENNGKISSQHETRQSDQQQSKHEKWNCQ